MFQRLAVILIVCSSILTGNASAHAATRSKYPDGVVTLPATSRLFLVTSRVFKMVTNVAICEEGGWGAKHDAHGNVYFGNLGWLNATWVRFRLPTFAHRMDFAPPEQQAFAMQRFAAVYGWPDQGQCTGGY